MNKSTSCWEDIATALLQIHVSVLAAHRPSLLVLCTVYLVRPSASLLLNLSVPSASHFAPTDRRASTLAHRVKRSTAVILQNQNTCSWSELLRFAGGKVTCLRRSETRC